MELCSVQIHQHKDDHGQATVEFALLLPLFIACIGVIIAAITLGLASLRLADTARLAARVASTSENPHQDVDALLGQRGITHVVTVDSTQQFLTVRLSQRIRIPLVGLPIPHAVLTAQSTVLREVAPILGE